VSQNYKSGSFEDTYRYGKELGNTLRGGEVIVLTGVLGSGKTVFAKGIADALGVEEIVTSPSFTIMNEYSGRLLFCHFDFYRIDDEAEMEDLLGDYAYRADTAVAIEWGEKALHRLGSVILVSISLLNDERVISVARSGA
jgi:tRNA threonylcarbamoyladenosine biosynthesis protein TsaE